MAATSVFISYSHKDEFWLLRLQPYLLALNERENRTPGSAQGRSGNWPSYHYGMRECLCSAI